MRGATQLEKFKEAARHLETDDDPDRFRERVGKLVATPIMKDKVSGRRKGG